MSVSMMSEIGNRKLGNIALNTAGMVAGAILLLLIGLYESHLILLFGGEHMH